MARKKKSQDEAGFEEAGLQRARLTPVDIQQKVFRLSFRGYNERDVDEFLDHITEDIAALHEENKRLREQLAEGGGGGQDSNRQAEAIVRQAREHAARLIEEAERASRDSSGGAVPASFLLRERDFLQTLAQTVQDHARWLKDEAGRPKAAPAAPVAPAPVSAAKAPASGAKASGGAPAAATTTPPAAEPRARAVEPAPRAAEPPADQAQASAAPAVAAAAAAPAVPDEPTAAWSPEGTAQEGPWGGGGSDPLISAWESAFTSDEAGAPAAPRPAGEGEPSLRELFWGEE